MPGGTLNVSNTGNTEHNKGRKEMDEETLRRQLGVAVAISECRFFSDRRHGALLGSTTQPATLMRDWRMRERLKTVSVVLMLCLNIGVDPPDVTKTVPAAKTEAWVDPFSLPPQKALETIGRNLQAQYEVWQPRARYRLSLDPSIEETKKLCCSLRRNAKEERILLHYNGHGVPKPTQSGELWVFNKNYTQYIPLSIYDVQSWLGSPCIYVYDCNTAGHILQAFNKFATQRDEEHAIAVANGGPTAAGTEATGAQSMERQTGLTSVSQQSQQPPAGKGALDPHSRSASQASLGPAPPYVPFRDCIQLASCRPNELLPMTPDLPADLFTCCLTTPIEIALRWFVSQNLLVKNITNEMILKIPGKLNDRRTPLGELNWIFTAITDTIAWNSLSHELFQKLFRQDLMVAALFRNFLLAERIMRHYGCHPLSMPVLPKTFQHPMWEAWDLAVDVCLTQLPLLLRAEETKTTYEYRHSTFFAEQLTAFEVGLSRVGISRKAPDQLPIVLQVLLSQVHRLRALMLLSRFLDLGPWAVNQALSVGIFPYVLKLLQSPALELKPVLVFIWCKILAVDRSCQGDLLKDEGFTYFVNILAIENADVLPHMPNISEHRAMCAFILANFCRGFPSGQIACYKADLLGSILPHLSDADPLLRQWACLCLATFWDANVEIKRIIVNESIHEQLFVLLSDPVPEVRSAAISALNTLLGSLEKTDSVVFFDHSVIMSVLEATLNDASPLVRTETIVILSRFVAQYPSKMTAVATELLEEERQRGGQSRIGRKSDSRPQSMPPNTDVEIHTVTSERSLWNDSSSSIKSSRGSKPVLLSTLYGIVWKTLLNMSVDPFPTVSNLASQVVDKVMMRVLTLSGLVNSTALSINSLNITPILANLELPSTRQNTLPSRVKSNSMQNLSSLAAGPAPARQSSSNGSKDSHTGSSTVGKISHTLGRSASIVFSSLFGPSAPVPASPVESLSDTRLASESRAILARAGSLKYRSNVSSQPASKPHSDLAQDRTYVADKDRLALESFLFEWSLEYFTEPQMKVPDSEDPGTQRYNQRLWRALRNERVTQETAKMKDLTGFQEVAPGGLHDELHPPVKALFHTFDPHLLSVDPFSRMCVYDWESGTKLNAFVNTNPYGSRISSLKFINEEDLTLVMAASDEGMIRLYADYADPADCHLVSSWRGLPDSLSLIPPRGKGLISDWHQRTGHLWVGGHSSQIRIWDAGRETAVADLPTRSDKSGVCSLSVDPSNGSLVVAGFLDGRIRVYDGRVSPSESLVHEFAKEHSREILRARFLPQGQSTLLAGSADGSVKLWDMRHLDSVKTFVTRMEQDTMTGFDIHPMAPIFVWYGYFAERWKQHLGSVHYYETQWRFNAEHTCNDLGGRRKAFGHDQVYRELLVRQKNGASWTLVLSPATLALGGKLIEFPGRVSFCRTNGSCQLRVVNVYPKKCRLGLLSNNQYKLCKEDGIFSIDEG